MILVTKKMLTITMTYYKQRAKKKNNHNAINITYIYLHAQIKNKHISIHNYSHPYINICIHFIIVLYNKFFLSIVGVISSFVTCFNLDQIRFSQRHINNQKKWDGKYNTYREAEFQEWTERKYRSRSQAVQIIATANPASKLWQINSVSTELLNNTITHPVSQLNWLNHPRHSLFETCINITFSKQEHLNDSLSLKSTLLLQK